MKPILFRLEGETRDLEELGSQFSEEPGRVVKEDGFFYLEIPMPLGVTDAEALEAARERMAVLNAILGLQAEGYRFVRVHGVSRRDLATGKLLTRVELRASGTSRSSGRAILTVLDASGEVVPPSQGPTPGESALGAIAANRKLTDAFFLFGSVAHDWRGLYLVWDAIKVGHGGREKDVFAVHPNLKPAIKRFTRTANSYAALGLNSRHGPQTGQIVKAEMTLADAQALIQELLDAWLRKAGP